MALRTGLLMLPAYEPARLAALAALAEDTGYDDFWLADERSMRQVRDGLICLLHYDELFTTVAPVGKVVR